MPSAPKTSPVIRASPAATEVVDPLHNTRLEEATSDEERQRMASQHNDLIMTLAAILPEAHVGPPSPPPSGPRVVRRGDG